MGEQFLDRLISSPRVVVEKVIAGGTRCRIVKDVLRLPKGGSADLVMEIACSLHNLRVSWGALVKRGQSMLPAVGTLGMFGGCPVPGPLQPDGLPWGSLA